MIKHKYKKLLLILSAAILLLNACSFLGQRTSYNPSVSVYTQTTSMQVFSDSDYHTKKFGNKIFMIMPFYSSDSTFLGIQDFSSDRLFSFGLPYIPVIPNFTYPFFAVSDNKIASYHIFVSFPQLDSSRINNLRFYRNQKEIFPVSVKMIVFNDSILPGMRMYAIVQNDKNSAGASKNYYLFTFKIRAFSTKEIEIKDKEKQLLEIRRKMQWHYEPAFMN